MRSCGKAQLVLMQNFYVIISSSVANLLSDYQKCVVYIASKYSRVDRSGMKYLRFNINFEEWKLDLFILKYNIRFIPWVALKFAQY